MADGTKKRSSPRCSGGWHQGEECAEQQNDAGYSLAAKKSHERLGEPIGWLPRKPREAVVQSFIPPFHQTSFF
jgi:hypothetical protein